jgi:hypothetical protein
MSAVGTEALPYCNAALQEKCADLIDGGQSLSAAILESRVAFTRLNDQHLRRSGRVHHATRRNRTVGLLLRRIR